MSKYAIPSKGRPQYRYAIKQADGTSIEDKTYKLKLAPKVKDKVVKAYWDRDQKDAQASRPAWCLVDQRTSVITQMRLEKPIAALDGALDICAAPK